MAAFHDAGYWGRGTVLLLLASRERVWAQVRVVTSAAVTFTLLMLLFMTLDDLRDQILAFIAYYNRTITNKWTYTGLS